MELINKKTKRQSIMLMIAAGTIGEILTANEPFGIGFAMGVLALLFILFIINVILFDLTR
ncbi:MAG: hypothetical protein LBF71_05620 [Campylobacteraceae bacterium]|nr:hypothetical protein [Campylobacteraceae bacterium]